MEIQKVSIRITVAFVIAAVTFGQVPEVKNPHTTAADVTAGARIFRSHCAECHGMSGEGGRAPKLTTGVFFHGRADADLFNNITDGIPGTAMPGVFFSADQVWQIVAYVRSLSASGGASKPSGDARRGATLFVEKQCQGCHIAQGQGGVMGPDLSVIGSQRSVEHLRKAIVEPNSTVLPEHWVAKITLENGQQYSGFVMNEDTHLVQILDSQRGLQTLAKRDFRQFVTDKLSAMPSYQGRLSEAEVNDLVAYLWSLQRGAQ